MYSNYKKGNITRIVNLFPHPEIHISPPPNLKREFEGNRGQKWGSDRGWEGIPCPCTLAIPKENPSNVESQTKNCEFIKHLKNLQLILFKNHS